MSAAAKLNPQIQIKLMVQKGPHAGQRFAFNKNKITIGRSPENDIILVNDPLISRQHAYIQINQNDVEIINLSSKNPILVNKEMVNKWKLTQDSIFTIGDTEFLVQIEGLQSIVVVKPQPVASVETVVATAPINNVVNLPKKQPIVQVSVAQAPQPIRRPAPPRPQPQAAAPKMFAVNTTSTEGNNRFKIYGIVGLLIAAGLYYLFSDSNDGPKKAKKATLKYSDEISVKINSKEAEEARLKQEKLARLKQNPAFIRAEENFSKGMRAYQLGNYGDSIDYFQQALNSQADHLLAKRYLQLSLVRFDEMVKLKLDLGQSYFERNNFKLCRSMYQQVIDMLQSKESLQVPSKDINLKLAQTMVKKCEFAAEGIH